MLYFLTTKNRAVAQALRNQSRQRGGFAEGLAVPPEAQTANTQNLLRSRIRAGNYPGGIDHQQAGGHITRDFFAKTLGMSGALLFDAVQPLQLLLLIAELLDYPLHGRGHERGRVLCPGRLGRSFFASVSRTKIAPRQEEHHDANQKNSDSRAHAKGRQIRRLACLQHREDGEWIHVTQIIATTAASWLGQSTPPAAQRFRERSQAGVDIGWRWSNAKRSRHPVLDGWRAQPISGAIRPSTVPR